MSQHEGLQFGKKYLTKRQKSSKIDNKFLKFVFA